MNYTTVKSSIGLVTHLVPLKEYKVALIGKRPNVSTRLKTEIQQYEGNSFCSAGQNPNKFSKSAERSAQELLNVSYN